MTKSELRKVDKRIEAAYLGTCKGVQVSMMDIPKIFAEGRKAVAEGADDEALRARIVAFVETIRKN